jgi:2-dehydro-3-deoxyphosphooctonate aldolase (KDO 8-P synthase)
MHTFKIKEDICGGDSLTLIAGPCVIESREHSLKMAHSLKEISDKVNLPIIFKSSFDKANRSSLNSFRGLGLEEGLSILNEVKEKTGLPILTDFHEASQAKKVATVADVLQIPAFLSRQTDMLVAAAKTGKIVNIKKGQFLSPWDIKQAIQKVEQSNCKTILVTERGTQFGYNNLVSDMRSIPIMQEYGYPVIFDATHSCQLPGGHGSYSGGMREMIPYLAKAAVAVGCNGLFFEVHDNPEKAKSDAATQWPLNKFENLLNKLKDIYESTR